MTTSEKIIQIIKEKRQISGADIARSIGISRQALFKHLTKLLASGAIIKIGKPPKVFYLFNEITKKTVQKLNVSEEIKKIINKRFMVITPAGERMEGMSGFVYWCDKNNLPVEKTAKEYIHTLLKYDGFHKHGFIDGMNKIKNTFQKVYLDAIFYLDFYSIERFGKTKLGQLLLYAKQSQNLGMMDEIIKIIKPKVDKIVQKFRVDGIGFIPPTVKREKQFIKILERGLSENIRRISIVKVMTPVAVPQKTLNKLEDRIENAKNTIVVNENAIFKNILLIDDAIGSGATLNETAKKIKEKGICGGKIIGLSITGSFKGFDVISEI